MKKICIVLLLLVALPFAGAQEDFYKTREFKAHPAVKSRLASLRQQLKGFRATYNVGYTTALDIPLNKLVGLVVPRNFSQQIQQQNKIASELNQIDDAEFEKFKKLDPKKWADIKKRIIIPCFSNASKWDWRRRGKVTPVKNQGACGSCWAFATLGAYEGNFALRNGVKFDLSEQNVLSCSGAGSCSGGWWAFNHLIQKGVPKELAYPYTASNAPCNTNAAGPYYRAVSWGYVVNQSSVPSVAQLKAALCAHGPLAVAVRVTPGFQAYTGGVFNENSTGNVNHGVTLIGWDDSKSAWLIKNSWGTGWGSTCEFGNERGYMWIAYNSNKIGYAAAWVRAQRIFYRLPKHYYARIKKLIIIPKDHFRKIEPIKK